MYVLSETNISYQKKGGDGNSVEGVTDGYATRR